MNRHPFEVINDLLVSMKSAKRVNLTEMMLDNWIEDLENYVNDYECCAICKNRGEHNCCPSPEDAEYWMNHSVCMEYEDKRIKVGF